MKTSLLLPACGLTVFLGNLIFFGGYFPIKKTIPRHAQKEDSLFQLNSSCLSVNNSNDFPDCYVKPLYDRLVFVLIDAMRKDFILESRRSQHLTKVDEAMATFKRKNLKFINELINSTETLTFQSHVLPPTVTLSGIKTLTTGAVSAFVDVVWNFGSGAMMEDNILEQLKQNGKRMLFYGDETWLRLFPGAFLESDGTTSFFVNDYTEVDHNVTRHLEKTTNRTDWDCLFLHYLGLDHIGHLSGPSSAPVGPKLREMDGVIEYLKTTMDKKDELEKRKTLLVLTSDHGMTDDGSHGGSSKDELSTPLVLVGSAFKRSKPSARNEGSLNQVDLVPTLSFLLGIPIPSNSVGVLASRTLESLGVFEVLKAVNINCRQLLRVIKQNVDDFEENEHNKLLQKTIERHRKLLQTASPSSSAPPSASSSSSSSSVEARKVLADYQVVLDGLSRELVSRMSTYDLPTLRLTSVLVFLCSLALLWRLASPTTVNPGDVEKHLAVPALVSVVGGGAYLFAFSHEGTIGWKVVVTETLVVSSLFIFTEEVMAAWKQLEARIDYIKKSISDPATGLATLGVVLHCLSMSSSSFVEEEQNTHHFFVVTFLLLIFFILLSKEISRPHLDRSALPVKVICGIVVVTVMAVCRLAKAWNRTGDKWKHLEDVGDWLNRQENGHHLLLLVLVSMATLLILELLRCRGRTLATPLLTSGFVSAFVLQLHGGRVGASIFGEGVASFEEIRIVTAQISLGTSALLSVTSIFGGLVAPLGGRRTGNGDGGGVVTVSICEVMKDLRLSLIIVSLTLCRPHNCILILLNYLSASFLHLFFCRLSVSSPSSTLGPGTMAVFYLWMGHNFFYYQGNSNNLTGIDFSVAGTGQRSHSFVAAAVLTSIHTFSPLVFWLLSLFVELLSCQKEGKTRDVATRESSAYPLPPKSLPHYEVHDSKVSDDSQRLRSVQKASIHGDSNDDVVHNNRVSSVKSSAKSNVERACLSLLSVQSFFSSFYLVVMIVMRHHLFVWSVFAPKFLYAVVLHLLVTLFVVLCHALLGIGFSYN